MADDRKEEWEYSEDERDTARRATGAGPPLPQKEDALSILGNAARKGHLAAAQSGAFDAFLARNPQVAKKLSSDSSAVAKQSTEEVVVAETQKLQDAIEGTTIRKYLPEIVAFISLEALAIPFFQAGADAVLNNRIESGIYGYLIGGISAVAGFAFHWWKKWPLWKRVQRFVIPLWWAPILLAFIYIAGPEMYQRATSSRSVLSPASRPTAAANPALPALERFYSTAEKEELANRISTTYQILNSDMLELAEQWLAAYSHNLGSKADAEQFLKEINALHGKTLAVHKKLWEDTVNGNPNFSAELRKLIAEDAAFPKLETAIGNFNNGVSLYFLTYDYLTPTLRDQFAQLLRPFQGALFEGASGLKQWVNQSDERIAKKRKSL